MLPNSHLVAWSLVFLPWLSSLTIADSYFFPNNSFNPYSSVNTDCSTAIQASVDCPDDLLTFAIADTFYPLGNETYQNSFCDPSCGSALSTYVNNVQTACTGQPEPFQGLPATYYGNFAWSSWNLTCLQDSTGQFCIDYFFGIFNTFSSTQEVLFSQLTTDQLCTQCTYLFFQQIQGTPYSNYQADVAADWASVQAICGVAYPTAVPAPFSDVTSIPGYAPTNVVYSSQCLSGNTYTAVSGDNVQAIAQAKGVATGTLIAINNLLPDGSDLQVGQVLCLPYACEIYTVVTNDTCDGIASTYSISFTALLGYNPTINPYCTNLLVGRSICVSPPGGVYTATTISGAIPTQTAIYASTTVTAPGPTASGTTANCGKYYQVQTGDFCQVISLNQTISLPLFEAINPSIDIACDNLTPGLWYCVSPLQYWNQTGTPTTPTEIAPPTITPDGTTDDCYQWYIVQTGDYCALIETSFGITFTQLQMWNPDLLPDCSNLLAGEAYCVDSPITTSLTVPAPTTTVSGTTSNCYAWYIVQSGDTCDAIDTEFSITLAQFLTWNTGVDAACDNIEVGIAYCVSSPLSPPSTTTTSTTTTSTIVAAPTTTVAGTTSDCYAWYIVQSGDSCDAIDTTYSITLAQFLAWNTGVDTACDNIDVGIAYCVNSPIVPSSKIKRKIGTRDGTVRGWPIVKAVRNKGLVPKFPGLSRAYDRLTKREVY